MNARNIASISALTPIQEGILFHAIADRSGRVYHSQFSARIDGALDGARWRAAWDRVIARHDTLRTLFTWEGRDKPLQIVRERVATPWQELDWSDTEPEEHGAMLDALFDRDRDLGFELDRAPLLRLILIRLGPNQHRFVLTFHHLILDGWSMRLIIDEAQKLYAQPDALPQSAPSFTRFVEWQTARDSSNDQAWWGQRLADFDSAVFPLVHDDAEADNVSHHIARRTLDDALTETLNRTAREQRVTPSSVIAAAWALLLARYTDTDDVVFGTTCAGRPPQLPEVENMAGMFINTLPLRVKMQTDASVADYLQDVQRAQVEQREMEASKLGVAQRASGVSAGAPLFESILVYENFPAAASPPQHDFTLSIDHFVEYSHFPLAILAVPGSPFELIGISDPQRLGAAPLQDLMDNLLHTVAALLNNMTEPLKQVSTLNPEQRDKVVRGFNATEVAAPEATTLWHQIAQHASRSPQAIALIDEHGESSYADLMERANTISSALLKEGVAAADPILVIGPRSSATIAAIVGVHGAGAAYVPVAADAPAARLAQIIAEFDRPVRALMIGATNISLPDTVQVIRDDDLTSADRGHLSGPQLDSSAYYMFTSGSTGTPKGVDVSHRNLFHSVHARDCYYADSPTAFALLSSLATDSSVAGLFWTLGRGGTLVLPGDRAEQDMEGLVHYLTTHQVTHLLTVPSLYGVLLDHAGAALDALQMAIVAGEACTDAVVNAHTQSAPGRALHNEYGPTETTVWCSAARLEAGASVSIGRPLANTQTFVLDRRQRPVPVGVAGELYVGGPQVAQGYVGDVARTARQFIASPFATAQRLYRTGDQVRWTRQGTLSFVGRVDDQIKVRGFRVEPGEIEARLLADDHIQDAAVLLHQASTNTPLVAFVTATTALDASALRQTLNEQLPGYMVPRHIEVLDSLPRTAAGKVDRRALASLPLAKRSAASDASLPTTDHERVLADIWRDVLGIDAVGIHDDFFAVGGDSLLSIRVLARAGKAGLRIAPADFFAWPTIAGQAAHADHSGARRITQKPISGPQPLMPIQHWFFENIGSNAKHWNLSYCFELATDHTLAHVQRAVAALLTTHDALRSAFEWREEQWHCRVHAPQEFDVVSQLDLRQEDPHTVDAAVHGVADRLNATFDLAVAPLVRACLIHTPDDQPQRLVVIVHHLVVDAESWRILIEDLGAALGLARQKQPIRLPEKTDALATFSKRLVAWSNEAPFAAIESQWQSLLEPPASHLAPEHGPTTQSFTEGQCAQHVATLSAADTDALLAGTSQTRATTLELLLAGVATALGQHLQSDRVRFDIEGHGREALFDDLDISRTVGWMTTAFPITISKNGDWQDVSAVLREVKSRLRELPQRGLSYGVIMASDSVSDAARAIRNVPRATVLFNYLGQRDVAERTQRLRLIDERCGQARAADAPRAYLLEMNAIIDNGCLGIHMVYPQPAFSQTTMDTLGNHILTTLRALGQGDTNAVVPQDFPLANLDQKGLSDLSDLLDELDD